MSCRPLLSLALLWPFVAARAQSDRTAAIQGAAVRWFIAQELPKLAPRPSVICVRLGSLPGGTGSVLVPVGNAPLDAMGRIRAPVPVRTGAGCRRDARSGAVVEAVTGDQGVELVLGPIGDLDDGGSDIRFDFLMNMRYGEGRRCLVMQRRTRWSVASCRTTWVA